MKKQERIDTIKRMFAEVARETGLPRGFNEASQMMEDLLLECIPFMNKEGHEIVMKSIERNSYYGINRKEQVLMNEKIFI